MYSTQRGGRTHSACHRWIPFVPLEAVPIMSRAMIATRYMCASASCAAMYHADWAGWNRTMSMAKKEAMHNPATVP